MKWTSIYPSTTTKKLVLKLHMYKNRQISLSQKKRSVIFEKLYTPCLWKLPLQGNSILSHTFTRESWKLPPFLPLSITSIHFLVTFFLPALFFYSPWNRSHLTTTTRDIRRFFIQFFFFCEIRNTSSLFFFWIKQEKIPQALLSLSHVQQKTRADLPATQTHSHLIIIVFRKST